MLDAKRPETERTEDGRALSRRFLSRLVPKSPAAAILPESVPLPPEKPVKERVERPLTNFLSGLLSFVLIFAVLVMAVIAMIERSFTAAGPLTEEKVVIVRGSTSDVIDQLEREGVIDQPFLLALGWQLSGKASMIKAGEYAFKSGVSLADVTDVLVEGKSVLHSLTFPEGLTSTQIVERLLRDEILSGEVREIPKEGTLLPETYKFTRGMTRTQLLDRMAQEQARTVKEIWERRSAELPISSPQEMVILASIVEKETGKADERPRVASVFINRLNKQMKLQSDPTIVYGLVGGKGTLGRPILKSEIESATPFNTYVIPGLPIGPITNPGKAALEAVANPSRTKDLYFVADGTGGHAFSETLEQHNRNVLKWRQIEAERVDSTAGALTPAPQPVEVKPATPAKTIVETPTQTAPPKVAVPAKPAPKPPKKKVPPATNGTQGALPQD